MNIKGKQSYKYLEWSWNITCHLSQKESETNQTYAANILQIPNVSPSLIPDRAKVFSRHRRHSMSIAPPQEVGLLGSAKCDAENWRRVQRW